MKPRHFKSAGHFRRWLETHHASERELWVGFYRKASGKGGLTYPEAVDAALCFGWIDGVKKRIDEASYVHRFSPRTRSSYWSAVNTKRFNQLVTLGAVAPPGLEVFERRDQEKTEKYSFERKNAAFDAAMERAFKANAVAWTFFRAQPPGYRRLATFFVMSAKQEETRRRRLAVLAEMSAKGERLR